MDTIKLMNDYAAYRILIKVTPKVYVSYIPNESEISVGRLFL